jgi:hypothetical protein
MPMAVMKSVIVLVVMSLNIVMAVVRSMIALT